MKPTPGRAALIVCVSWSLTTIAPALSAPKRKPPPAMTDEQKEADRHFKSGVALFGEAKFGEALAEFERAYEIAPHPLVLYNIAGCHRELSQYGQAVKFYRRFLDEGKGQVPAARLTAARAELDGILARIARVTVAIAPEGASLFLDDNELGTLVEMPLILPPGEHRLVAKAPGRQDAIRVVRVASGDELTIDLSLPELPPQPPPPDGDVERPLPVRAPAAAERRFVIGAAFGTNLLQAADTGAPALHLGVALGRRLELGIDAVVVAYAVMPALRVRLAGDALSVHAVAAVPISIASDEMSETFVAGAAGLGLRYRATPALALRLESLASFAGGGHGLTVPTFLGGELWF
ncbi:MAG: hypothetical protein KBG28_00335 [Kofleriaceae bacterium]|nr:hypothetical protein [Kofleriaceae bacterium]MBP6838628.1 hypothetical protein [Kofleriaceae bacterium]MBP9202395.1 hypothetical protein [Kofleriaceae bacterium]